MAKVRFGSSALHFGLLVCSCLGLLDAANLSLSHHLNIVATCSGLGQCEKVLTSPYSQIAGLPISDLGVLGYGLVLLGCLVRTLTPRSGSELVARSLIVITGLGSLASIGLQGLSLFVLHAVCPYCIASAILMFLSFAFALAAARAEPDATQEYRSVLVFTIWILSLTALATLRRWDTLRWESLEVPVDSSVLAMEPVRRLVPEKAIADKPGPRPRTYVAFYDSGCGGCANSFRHASAIVAKDPSARMVVRFMAKSGAGTPSYLIGAAFEGLAADPRDMSFVTAWYSGQDDLGAVSEFRKYLASQGVHDPVSTSSPLVRAGSAAVEANLKECRSLGAAGAPVVIEIESDGTRVAVNPMTLRPF